MDLTRRRVPAKTYQQKIRSPPRGGRQCVFLFYLNSKPLNGAPLKSTDEVTCDKNCEKEEGLEGGLLQPSCVEPHASGGQGFVDKEVGPG